jgi:hypothetical protein
MELGEGASPPRHVDYMLFYCPTNVATSNYGSYMEMKHMYIRDRLCLHLLKHFL